MMMMMKKLLMRIPKMSRDAKACIVRLLWDFALLNDATRSAEPWSIWPDKGRRAQTCSRIQNLVAISPSRRAAQGHRAD